MDEGQGNPWDAPEDTGSSADDVPEVGADPTAAADTPSAAPVATTAPPTPPAAPDPAFQDDEPDPNRNRVVLIALGAFVVIALVGFFLSRGGGDPSTDGGSTTTVAAGATGTGTNPAQLASITGTVDGFGRADSSDDLGTLPNGSKWTVQTGGWGINGNAAYVANPDATHRNIAWVGTGYATGQVSVKITKMAPQAGVIFRYSGPCSYWAVESSPAVASWNIVEVDKCKAKPLGNTGYTPVADGVVIGVQFNDTKVTIVVNGKVVKTLDNSDLAGSGKVGMVVSGKQAGQVRFDDFTAGGSKGEGIVKPDDKATPGATTTTVAAGKSTTTTTTK